MGRPPKKKTEKQSANVMVRLTPAEYRLLRADAESAGKSMAAVLLDGWKSRRA